MMESPSLEAEKIMTVVRNLFRLKKLKKNNTTNKDIRNLLRLEKENE